MPLVFKCPGIDVFQYYFPEQSKQSTEGLVSLRPRDATCMWMSILCVSTLVHVSTCLCLELYIFDSACLCVLCVYVLICLYGGCVDVHCRLNDMVDNTFGYMFCLTNTTKENPVIPRFKSPDIRNPKMGSRIPWICRVSDIPFRWANVRKLS